MGATRGAEEQKHSDYVLQNHLCSSGYPNDPTHPHTENNPRKPKKIPAISNPHQLLQIQLPPHSNNTLEQPTDRHRGKTGPG